MPRFAIKRYEQILAQMIAKVVTRSKLSDVADVAAVKNLLAASARSDDTQYYQMLLLRELFSIYKCRDDDLDERAKEVLPADLSRNLARKSSGNVVFYRDGTVGTITIAAGQKVLNGDGIVFTTTAAGSISNTSPEQVAGHGVGRDSGLIPAVADTAGAAGNTAANTITKFVTKPPGVVGVTNPSAFNYGMDKETDDSFINRIVTYVASLARSPLHAMEFAVLDIEDPDTGAKIIYSKGVETPGYVTIYIDDGTGSAETYETVTGEVITANLSGPPPGSAVGGETYLFTRYKPIKDSDPFTLISSIRGALVQGTDYYLNSASGQINFTPALAATEVITGDYTRYTGLIAEAQKVIDGDPADRTNYPGYRGGGVLVWIKTPNVLVQNVEVILTVASGYDDVSVKSEVIAAIKSYINSLGISGDVLTSDLIAAIKAINGVYNVKVITPANDVVLLDDQLARTTDANITVN